MVNQFKTIILRDKMVDLVKGEEISATSTYHSLTKENSELLRRYCFYLKLKIDQL